MNNHKERSVIYRQRTEDDGLAYTLIIKLSNTVSQEFLLLKKKNIYIYIYIYIYQILMIK